jgi:chorismate dehydratase
MDSINGAFMVRIGMVNYINTAPIFEMWKRQVNRPEWKIIEAPPSTLNQMLAKGEIDLGFVSSYEYAVRPDRYMILSDLSISADGPVGSVFLFSKVPARQLGGKRVLLTGQSDTSIALLKIILEEFYQILPEYKVGEIFDYRNYDEEVVAVLAIGDEALRLKMQDSYPHRIDLSEIWNQTTALPFVFALCAVRMEFVQSDPAILREIWSTLLDCRDNGLNQLEDVCKNVAPRIPMSRESCYHYLKTIQYNLSPAHQRALEKFFSYLIKRDEADKNALPLKFFPENHEST